MSESLSPMRSGASKSSCSSIAFIPEPLFPRPKRDTAKADRDQRHAAHGDYRGEDAGRVCEHAQEFGGLVHGFLVGRALWTRSCSAFCSARPWAMPSMRALSDSVL